MKAAAAKSVSPLVAHGRWISFQDRDELAKIAALLFEGGVFGTAGGAPGGGVFATAGGAPAGGVFGGLA